MVKQTWTCGRIVLSVISLSLFLISGLAEARNPDLSYWTKDISESSAPTEPGEEDFNQEIEVVGSTVHVMWFTTATTTDYSRKVFYRRSTDGGQTWEDKQLLLSKAQNDLGVDDTYKRMVVTGNTVHIAVNYKYEGRWVLGYLRSTDNGASFEPIRNLFADADTYSLGSVYVAAGNDKVTIGFMNRSFSDVYTCLILNTDDGGASFNQHTVFSNPVGASWRVYDLQRVGDRIYVLYTGTKEYTYSRTYVAASGDAGVNFTSTKISVPSSNGEDQTGILQDVHYVAKIAGVGNTVTVIWNGLDGDDVHSIFYRRSLDSGQTWGNAVNLSRGAIPEGKVPQRGQETLAAQGDYVYSLFLATAGNVYFRRSTDGGANFQGLQELTAVTPPYPDSFVSFGWWPVIKTDPTVPSGAKVHVLWDYPTYCYSADGGATFTKPELVTPRFSYSGSLVSGALHPYMNIGPDGRVHFVVQARYYAISFGGYGDFDIFYRVLSPAPAPSGSNNGLHLVSNTDDARYDNMQVTASSYMNFTSQMTGEVWVKPYPGGRTDGTTGVTKYIFHKNEGSNPIISYGLQTADSYGKRQARTEIRTTDGHFLLGPAGATDGLVTDGVWNHLAFTYDAGGGANNFKLYLNGQLIAQSTATGNLVTGDGGLFFTGYYGVWDVAELRLWNVARTQAQIAANMKRTLVGNEAGLNAYYTFQNTTKDLTGHGNDGILMYMEQYIQQNVLKPGAGAAVNLLLLMN